MSFVGIVYDLSEWVLYFIPISIFTVLVFALFGFYGKWAMLLFVLIPFISATAFYFFRIFKLDRYGEIEKKAKK